MVKVQFLPVNKTVQVPPGSSILEAAIRAGVQIESTCGGKGTCGKCQVQLSSAKTVHPSAIDKKFLSAAQLAQGWVLACKYILQEDAVIILRENKDVFHRKIGFKEMKIKEVSTSIGKFPITVEPPSVTIQTPDWERLLAALPISVLKFNRLAAAALPEVLRRKNNFVTVVMDGNELLAVESGDTSDRCYGLAIDIGTTTMVVHLLDLLAGIVVDSGAASNPQQVFGADVISRINHAANNPQGLVQLQNNVVKGLNSTINKLCQNNGVSSKEIYQATVVGNTTMTHLFLGIDPTYLAPAPFIPVFQQEVEVEAGELGLNMLGKGKVIVLPNVAGYVGSDTVGVMLAARIDELQGINLLIDIGTNGELILTGKNRILTCSTAAGPAFEGAEIKYGMRASEGAIEGVEIREDVQLQVIGDQRARGICGSGLIDAVAEMLRRKIIDSSGRFAKKTEQLEMLPPLVRKRVRHGERGIEFVLVWAEDSAIGEDIVLTQKDIRELQLAKGAIAAGIRILLREMGVEISDIDQVFLAGSFGNYIKKESALSIGLLPPLPIEQIFSIGNAAGEGAKMALVSITERKRAAVLAKGSEHVELSIVQGFQMEFIKSLPFGSII